MAARNVLLVDLRNKMDWWEMIPDDFLPRLSIRIGCPFLFRENLAESLFLRYYLDFSVQLVRDSISFK